MSSFRSANRDNVIIPELDYTQMQAQRINSALKNRAFSNATATAGVLPTQTTAGMNLILATCLLTVRASGIFQAGFEMAITGGTATATIDASVQSQTVASGLTQSAAAVKVGPGAGVATNGAFSSNAAGGIIITGGGGSLLQYDTGSQVLGTAATTVTIGWSGVIHNSVTLTAETPFAFGNQILLALLLNTSAAVTFRGFSIWLVEQP